MKKISLFLITILLLTACAKTNLNYQINLEEKNIINKNGIAVYSNKDLFNDMLKQGTINLFISNIIKDIYELEKLSPVDEEALKLLNEYKTTLGDNFKIQLANIGFNNEDDFLNSIKSRLMNSALTKEFIKLSKDNFFKSYHPTKIEYAVSTNKDDILKVVENIKSGINLSDASKNHNINVLSVLISEKTETLPTEVKSYALSNEVGLSDIIEVINPNGINTYYLVNIIDNNPNNFENEALDEIATHIQRNEMLKYYFDKYQLEIYEQNLYDQFQISLPGVIK